MPRLIRRRAGDGQRRRSVSSRPILRISAGSDGPASSATRFGTRRKPSCGDERAPKPIVAAGPLAVSLGPGAVLDVATFAPPRKWPTRWPLHREFGMSGRWLKRRGSAPGSKPSTSQREQVSGTAPRRHGSGAACRLSRSARTRLRISMAASWLPAARSSRTKMRRARVEVGSGMDSALRSLMRPPPRVWAGGCATARAVRRALRLSACRLSFARVCRSRLGRPARRSGGLPGAAMSRGALRIGRA